MEEIFIEIRSQQRIAAKILKCGESRIWVDPARIGDVTQAITSYDVRKLILKGIIKERPKKGLSTFRRKKKIAQKKKGRQKGPGSRKGKKGTRFSRKKSWINRVRSQRKMLSELRAQNKIDSKTFKILYRKSKGGLFRGRYHMKAYMEKTLGMKFEDAEASQKE